MNPLTALDLSGCSSLELLTCGYANLTELDVTRNPLLWSLCVIDAPIRKLDISQNPLMELLTCSSTDVEEVVPCDPASGVMPIVFLENNRLDDEELAKVAAWEEEVGAIVFTGPQRPPLTPEEPADPEEPSEPKDPSGPADPEDPSGPGEPTDPEEPADPDQPGEPSGPQDPASPEKPGSGQQGGSDAGKQPGGSAGGIPQTGDAGTSPTLPGLLGGALASFGAAAVALIRRRGTSETALDRAPHNPNRPAR